MGQYRMVDVERLVAEILSGEFPHLGVGTQLPGSWSRQSPPFLRVALNGIPRHDYPIVGYATIRVVAYGPDAPAVKSLALEAEATLLGASTDELPRVQPLTGVVVSTDPVNGWPIAAFTARVTARYQAIA